MRRPQHPEATTPSSAAWGVRRCRVVCECGHVSRGVDYGAVWTHEPWWWAAWRGHRRHVMRKHGVQEEDWGVRVVPEGDEWGPLTRAAIRKDRQRMFGGRTWEHLEWWLRDLLVFGRADDGRACLDARIAETPFDAWNWDHLMPIFDESPSNRETKQRVAAWESERLPDTGHAWNDPTWFIPRLGIQAQKILYFGIPAGSGRPELDLEKVSRH